MKRKELSPESAAQNLELKQSPKGCAHFKVECVKHPCLTDILEIKITMKTPTRDLSEVLQFMPIKQQEPFFIIVSSRSFHEGKSDLLIKVSGYSQNVDWNV